MFGRVRVTRAQILLLAAFTALAPLAIDMYLPAMPALARDLGVSAERAGQSLSVFLLGLALGQLAAGPLSDRLGRRPVILMGLSLFLVSAGAAAATTRFEVLLAARFVQALGACATMVSVRAIARDRFDERGAARFFSMLTLVAGMAPLVAPMMGALIVQAGSWRHIFVALAGFAAILLAVGIAILPETRSEGTRAQAATERPWSSFAILLRHPRMPRFLLAAVFNNAAFFTYVASAPVVLIDGYGFGPVQFGVAFAFGSVALVGASQINRMLLRRRGPQALLRASGRNALVLAVPLLLFALTQAGGLAVLLPLLMLMVGSVAPVQANTMAAGLSLDPLRAGTCAALFGSASFAGGALASSVAALLYDGTARGMTVVVACCIAGVGLALYRPLGLNPLQQDRATGS